MELSGWLRSLGLGQYEAAFRANEIDETVLPSLTADDLKELGVAALGHRRKLLDAIAALRTGESAKAPRRDALPSAEGTVGDTAERRQITVMFSDLVGSTALSARMDPEDLREVITAYQKRVAETVRRFDGFVARYMGDGVLVYFGYPYAHEDDAERAVRAGLELISAVTGLETRAPLQTRIGIATGLVVVGDLIGSGQAQEHGIVGETPNLAARLQGIAKPNMVVIAEGTRKLLGNLFELEDLGARELKGITGLVRAWAALRASSVESRFEALHATDLTALVGREEESEVLFRRWSRARAGEGQVVLLSGEPGIGKSRLAAALLERLSGEPHTRLRYFCSPQHTDSALYPIIVQMQRAAGLAHDDTTQTQLDKLDALLAQTSTSIQDAGFFAEMLSLANDGRYPGLQLTPQHRRQRTLEAMTAQLAVLASRQPVLMTFEDVHWADPTSLEAFDRIVDRIATLHVLLIVTFRPEFKPPWIGGPNVTALTINRLAQRDAGAMIDRIAGNKLLPARIRQDIIERSDGIPLFVEEMTKAVLEAASEVSAEHIVAAVPSPAMAVPASLHASLMARLDRLGPAKEVAQVGAAIGREFLHAVLAAVMGQPQAVESALDRLVAAGLLFRHGAPPHATYLFKHALVQDAAYGTLLREPRRALHARIAETLESEFAEIAEGQPELLARHCTEAGLIDKAAGLWEKAGQRSLSRPAMTEAAVHFRNALGLLTKLPPSEERDRKELDLLVALGSALAGAKGYGGDELHRTNTRARELSMRGDTRHLIAVFHGSFLSQLGRNVPAAPAIGEELLRYGRERGDISAQMMAHRLLGIGFWHLGRPISSRAHLEEALALYDPTRHRSMQTDIAAARGHCLEYLSLVLLLLGYAEQSNLRYQEARAETQELIAANPRSLRISGTYFNACNAQYLRRDVDRMAECADLLVDFARQNGLGPWSAAGKIWQGWVRAARGEAEDALAQMRQGLAEYRAAGTPHVLYRFIVVVAEVEARLAFRQEALAHLAEASALQDGLGARAYACDLLRIKGEVLAQSGDWTDAEACLRHSMALAREQEAPMWELRSAVALGRLCAAHGRHAEIRNLVAPVYSRFTEGLDTPDLVDAKRLLLDETA